jgi:hypothetical protein
MTSSYAVFDQTGKIAPDIVAWKHMVDVSHFSIAFARKLNRRWFVSASLNFGHEHDVWHVFLALPQNLSPYCHAIQAADGDDLQ